jgi:hypothetical protein
MTSIPFSAPAHGSRPAAITARNVGRALSALPVAFLLFDCAIKFTKIDAVSESMTQLGYPMSAVTGIAIVELVCLVAYLVPRTSFLGAVLLTGYLGGAVATHVRVDNPLFSHVLFPIYVALLLWGGLYLRDARLRALVSLGK